MTSVSPCHICGRPGRSARQNTICSTECAKESKRRYDREYNKTNKERRNKQSKDWASTRKEWKTEYDRQYRMDNAEKVLVARRSWTQNRTATRPDYGRLATQKRYARKLKNGLYKISERDIRRLHIRYKGLCAYCYTASAEHLDHVVPLARGGSHGIGNLLPACQHCNQSKGKKMVTEWRLVLKKTRTLTIEPI